jgi:hypothetical protein
MTESVQHAVVLGVVGLCVAWLLWQAFGSFVGRRSKVGSCCSTGCKISDQTPNPSASSRVFFLERDALSRKRSGA